MKITWFYINKILENTGFLEIPESIPTTNPPTTDEMQILQTKEDPLEVRKFDY